MSTLEVVLLIAGSVLVLLFQAAFLATIIWAVLKLVNALNHNHTEICQVNAYAADLIGDLGKTQEFIDWHGRLVADAKGSVDAVKASLDSLSTSPVIKDVLTAFSSLTPVVEEMKKANKNTALMAVATQKLQINVRQFSLTVARFADLVVSPDRTREGEKMKQLIIPDEADGDKEFTINQLIESGYDRQDAVQAVENGLVNQFGLGM
jgi:hypothetical protein